MEEKDKKDQKMSYEELNNAANQLSQENARLTQMNRQLIMRVRSIENTFKRLDYLIEIKKDPEGYSKEFISACIKEIEDIMTLPEEEENNKEE